MQIRRTPSLWIPLAVCCLTSFSVGPTSEPVHQADLTLCYINGADLYSCAFDRRGGPRQIAKCVKRDYSGTAHEEFQLPLDSFAQQADSLRWHVGGDCFWLFGQRATLQLESALRVPLGELHLYTATKTPDSGRGSFVGPPRSGVVHAWQLTPGFNLWNSGIRVRAHGNVGARPVGELCYDIIPISEESCLLFVLHDRQMRVFEGGAGDGVKSEALGYLPKYKTVTSFQVDFQEPFYVFGSPERFLFVTRSGKLFLAKRGGGAEPVKPLWKESDFPIVALVVDVGSGATFFLAQDTTRIRGQRKLLSIGTNEQLSEIRIDPNEMEPLPFGQPLETCIPFVKYLQSKRLLNSKKQ